jgi:hypothetical protein
MTIMSVDASQRTAARVAGVACLISMAAVVFAQFGIQSHLIVAGNAADTARNIMAHERQFRIAIALDLIYGAGVVVLLTALYVILKPVHRSLALLAASFRLVYALMWLVVGLNSLFVVLRLLGGAGYLDVFETDRLQALTRLSLGAASDAYYAGLPFYALASTVCSYLWFRSNYIPRALAAWGGISSVWCVICAFAFIVVPHFEKTVNLWWFDSPMALFEIALSSWLLFKGLGPSERIEPGSAGDRAQAGAKGTRTERLEAS